MSDRPRIGLDNPAFRGRLRPAGRPAAQSLSSRPYSVVKRSPSPRFIQDVRTVHQPGVGSSAFNKATSPGQAPLHSGAIAKPAAVRPRVSIVAPEPYAQPGRPKQQKSKVLRRQMVRRPPSDERDVSQPPSKRSKLQLVVLAMAGFIFLIGLFVSLLTFQTSRNARTQVAALSKSAAGSDAAASDAPPGETKPSTGAYADYQVAPTLPKYIKIPKLAVAGRVKPMSVNAKNELQAPASIYDAGWYSSSARPGDGAGNGAMLIDGHVHGPTLPGIFANIKKLVAGDEIQVTRGDNTVFNYTVVKTQTVDAANLDIGVALASARPGMAGLNLITCGGPYDHTSGEYTQRTIVFAILKS
ncbi:MAG: class F sortase [Candidatus Saccharibacteria bacterium]